MVNDKYAYAVGRIRSLETKMLDETKLIRMADAPDFQSAYAVLNETSYADHMQALKHPFDFEGLIDLELKSVDKFLCATAPEYGQADTAFCRRVLKSRKDLNEIKLALRANPALLNDITSRIRHTDYYIVIKDGLQSFGETGSMSLLEKQMDDFITIISRSAKYKAFGLEPLLAFSEAKQHEASNLRFILTCKRNQVDTNEIRKRIRMSYA